MDFELISLLVFLFLLLIFLVLSLYFSYKQEERKVELLESINTKLDSIGVNL